MKIAIRKKLSLFLTMLLAIGLVLSPIASLKVEAKGSLATGDTVKNLLIYETNAAGDEILISRLNVSDMLIWLNSHEEIGKVHNYAILDSYVASVHQEAQGFTVPQLLDYAKSNSSIPNIENWGLSFAGADAISFWEIDGNAFDTADTYTWDSLYGVKRYNFPALFANFNSSTGFSHGYIDKDAIWASRKEEDVLLSITAYSQRYQDTENAVPNMENFFDDRHMLDTAKTMRIMLPMTQDDFETARATAMNSRWGISYIKFDMANRPDVQPAGAVEKPTWACIDGDDDVADAYDSGYVYYKFSCPTDGATILYNDNSQIQYMPTAVYTGQALKVKKNNGKALINVRAVKEGYTDAGVVRASNIADDAYEEVVSPNADIWDGSIDTDWYTGHETDSSYEIHTAAQLAGLAKLTNNGATFLGKTVTLGHDIHLNSREWTPIADDKNIKNEQATTALNPDSHNVFSGIFDGGGHVVSGINLRAERLTGETLGFFGYLSGQAAVVRNLTISGRDEFLDTVYVGGLVGSVLDGARVANVVNRMYLTNEYRASCYTGGIAGRVASGCLIQGCTNDGQVKAYEFGGGIAGLSYGTIADSVNRGTIVGKTIGGIFATDQGYSAGIARACKNYGEIRGGGILPSSGSHYVAGIAGVGVAEKCENYGAVASEYNYSVAGIVGSGRATDCANHANISITNTSALTTFHGIIANGSAVNSTNDGNLTAPRTSINGVTGGTATGCANYGDITVLQGTAVGVGGNVVNGLNTGTISGTDAGGLTATGSVVASFNSGTIKGRTAAGGLGIRPSRIESSYNEGTITALAATDTPKRGGLAATATGEIKNSFDMTGKPLFDTVAANATFANVFYLNGTAPLGSDQATYDGLSGKSLNQNQMLSPTMVNNYLGLYNEQAGGGAGKGNFLIRTGDIPRLFWQPRMVTVDVKPEEAIFTLKNSLGTDVAAGIIGAGGTRILSLLRGEAYTADASLSGYLSHHRTFYLQEENRIAIDLIESMVNENRPSELVLNWSGDPKTTQSVSWTDASGGSQVVQYISGTAYTGEASLTGGTSVVATSKTLGSTNKTYYNAEMSGLKPNTKYYYHTGKPGRWSEVHSFTTAQSGKEDFSFLFMGDIQRDTGTAEQEYPVWGQLLRKAYSSNPKIKFALTTGDMVESGSDIEDWKYFLSYGQNAFADIPLMPGIGNHESNFPGGKPNFYLDIFNLPKGGPEGYQEEFYSFDYGSLHVTALNSWVLSDEQGIFNTDGTVKDQGALNRINQWIKDDLAGTRAKFKIVTMHHPAYGLVTDKVCLKVLEQWEPIFTAGGVDLALVGHQHMYNRTKSLVAGTVDTTNGLTWVMGNAGLKQYDTGDDTYAEKLIAAHGTWQIIDVKGDVLSLKSYDSAGAQIDSWSKTKQSIVVAGDVNDDGVADITDVNLIKAAVLAGGVYEQALDVNGDQVLDMRDAQYVVRMMNGK